MPMAALLHLVRPPAPQPQRPRLVYLPGLDGSGELFYRHIPTLAAHFEVWCVQLAQRGRPSWAELTGRLLARLRASGAAERPIWLAGESFGACLGLKLARAAPRAIARLIAINPASSFRERPLLSAAVPFVASLPDGLQRRACWGLLPLLADLQQLTASDRRALLTAMQAVPPAVVSWRLHLLSEFELADWELQQLHQPTLLIASAGDRLLPSVAEARRLARQLPRARTVIRPESGHACLLEPGWQLADLLAAEDFLPATVGGRELGVGSREWRDA